MCSFDGADLIVGAISFAGALLAGLYASGLI